MTVFREAGPDDLAGILRLCRQLQREDPVLHAPGRMGRGLLQSDAADWLAQACYTRVLQGVRFLAQRQDGVPRSPIVMP